MGATAMSGMYISKLEVLIMPNGEIICGGKHLGWLDQAPTKGGKKTFNDYIDEDDWEAV